MPSTWSIVSSTTVLGQIARDAVEEATVRNPRQSLVAVVFSVGWVEAYCEELLQHVKTERITTSTAVKLRAVLSVTKPAERVREIVQACSDVRIPLDQDPLRAYALLVDLRNKVIHQAPEWLPIKSSEPVHRANVPTESALLKRLAHLHIYNGQPERLRGGLVAALHYAPAARWAFNTAHAIMSLMIQKLPVENGHPPHLHRTFIEPVP